MRHHKTGEKISEGLFEKLQNAQKFQTGSAMLRQLYFGAMDMYINAKFDPMQKEETVFDVQAMPDVRLLSGVSAVSKSAVIV